MELDLFERPWNPNATRGGTSTDDNAANLANTDYLNAGIQNTAFCVRSGNQYDLNNMTGPFWTRLDTFLDGASQRDIVVQIEVWDRFAEYSYAPMSTARSSGRAVPVMSASGAKS